MEDGRQRWGRQASTLANATIRKTLRDDSGQNDDRYADDDDDDEDDVTCYEKPFLDKKQQQPNDKNRDVLYAPPPCWAGWRPVEASH